MLAKTPFTVQTRIFLLKEETGNETRTTTTKWNRVHCLYHMEKNKLINRNPLWIQNAS